jgi:hypothetical protein
MTAFWWVAGAVLLVSFGAASGGFMAYVATGDERYQELARGAWRWTVVLGLGAFNITIFKHIIGTLLSIWGVI